MRNCRWIMWQGLVTPSLERFILTPVATGFELNGLILQADDTASYVVRYRIEVDGAWMTQAVDLEVENGARRIRSLVRNRDGRWSSDGFDLPEFDGCVDVDLEWSPSTNTLPIRRLGLAPGATETVTAAWIRFPTLEMQPLVQSYERLSEGRYRYRSGAFSADLDVDDDGIVSQYGVNWRMVASSGDALSPVEVQR